MGKITNKKKVNRTVLQRFGLQGLLIFSLGLVLSIFLLVHQSQQTQDIRGHAQQTSSNCDPQEAVDIQGAYWDSEEDKMWNLINAYRIQNGVAPLAYSQSLSRAATWLSEDNNAHNSLSHTDSLGRGMSQRFEDCGVKGGLGEILLGGITADEAFRFKYSSQKNELLNPDYTQIGISRYMGDWTLDFGSDTLSLTGTITVIPSYQCMGVQCGTQGISPSPAPSLSVASPTNTSVNGGDNSNPGGILLGLIGLIIIILLALSTRQN